MSLHRLRFETIFGGFSTLIALIPWKVLHAAGWPEAHAAAVGGALLLVLAVLALLLHKRPFADRSFPILRETFYVSRFLRDFGLYSLALLAFFGGMWLLAMYGTHRP